MHAEFKFATLLLLFLNKVLEVSSIPKSFEINGKRKLLPDWIINEVADVIPYLHPADIIGRVDNVTNHVSCLSMCSKRIRCASMSYVKQLKLCLLSESYPLEAETHQWDSSSLTSSIYSGLLDARTELKLRRNLGAQPPPLMCGRNAFGYDIEFQTRISERIVDGFSPRPYDAPWVGILIKDNKVRCTISLISKNEYDKSTSWALVAKHCLMSGSMENRATKRQTDLTSYGVLFGIHDLRISTQRIIYRKLDRAYIYPDEGLHPKDLALIKFAKIIKYSGFINGLCLPELPDQILLEDSAKCFACGWGATNCNQVVQLTEIIVQTNSFFQDNDPPKSSNMLQCVAMDVQKPAPGHYIHGDTNSVLKIRPSDPNVKGLNQGDSGSPLFCKLPENADNFMFGLVTSCRRANGNSEGARVSYFMTWMNRMMNRRPSTNDNENPCCMFP